MKPTSNPVSQPSDGMRGGGGDGVSGLVILLVFVMGILLFLSL